MKIRSLILCAAAVAIASCSVSCEGLSLSITPDGRVVGAYQIPEKGVPIVEAKGGK